MENLCNSASPLHSVPIAMVRTLALAGLRERYPDDSPVQCRRRLADLILGPDLAARALGPGPEEG